MQESENQASVDEPEPSEPGSTEPNFDGTTGKPYLGNLIGFLPITEILRRRFRPVPIPLRDGTTSRGR